MSDQRPLSQQLFGTRDRPGITERLVTEAWDEARRQAIEECAALCDALRRKDYAAENADWTAGTLDCATAIRSLPLSSAPQCGVQISDAAGIEWFERTFGVPIGDKPGAADVERVRASVLSSADHGSDK